jgi:hypothetical protein
MKQSIGKTSYGDLGLLLEIGYAAYGVKKTMEICAVRHAVDRAEGRNVEKVRQTPLKPVYAPDFGGRKVP